MGCEGHGIRPTLSLLKYSVERGPPCSPLWVSTVSCSDSAAASPEKPQLTTPQDQPAPIILGETGPRGTEY